jgi:YD repeat-containing protein
MNSKPVVKTLFKYAQPIKSLIRSGAQDEVSEYLILESNFNEQGLLLEEKKYFDDQEIEEHHTYSYDEKGQLVLHIISIPSDGIEERFVTVRNDKGSPVEITKLYGEEDGEKVIYNYNSNDLIVGVEHYDADSEHESSEVIEYDSSNRPTQKTIENHLEKSKQFFEFVYDESGNLIEQIEKDIDRKLVAHVFIKYDDKNREVETIQKNEAGKVISKTNFSYNEANQLTERFTVAYYTRVTNFEYDESGRLTEESVSDENGFVISRRRFEYEEGIQPTLETFYETDLSRSGKDEHFQFRYEHMYFTS